MKILLFTVKMRSKFPILINKLCSLLFIKIVYIKYVSKMF